MRLRAIVCVDDVSRGRRSCRGRGERLRGDGLAAVPVGVLTERMTHWKSPRWFAAEEVQRDFWISKKYSESRFGRPTKWYM